jgi:hypothetical protein
VIPNYYVWPTVQFSRSGERRTDARWKPLPNGSTGAAGLSKLSSMCAAPARERPFGQIRSTFQDRRRDERTGGLPVQELPRKEVIQPHLPVRLPCYDFTPITSPTFDGSLP